MKRLVLLLAALLVAGCGEKSSSEGSEAASESAETSADTPNSLSDADIEQLLKEAVELDFEYRDGLYYQINESEPYSGWTKSMYDSGQVRSLARFWEGKRDGLGTVWYENGEKQSEATRKDGKEIGVSTSWRENGLKWMEATYEDGEEVSIKWWNSKGEEVETAFHALLTEEELRFPLAKPPPAETPVAESPSEESSDTPNSLSDADIQRLLKVAIEMKSLQERNGIYYQPNRSKPYSGWAKVMYDSGQVEGFIQYKDGKLDGLATWWRENGQKRREGTFKDGKNDGLFTAWHENGQKQAEVTWKDDEGVSAKYWNSKGEEVETWEESKE